MSAAAAASVLPHAGGAALCAACAALILLVGRRGATAWLLAAAAAAAAAWAAAVALRPEAPLDGAAGALEVARNAVWLALLLALHRRAGGPAAAPLVRRFAAAGAAAAALALAAAGAAAPAGLPGLGSPAVLGRIALALLVVAAAENLYRNAGDEARWHVNLPAIALGGLAAFDLVLYADAALSRAVSPVLLDARVALAALAMPLLAVAAVRDRRWRQAPPAPRRTVFHGATLVVAGAFLLGVGTVGEALRHLGAGWGQAAQASLIAGALMAAAVVAASPSARSRLRNLIVDQFFTARYDYRREWLRCVAALSAPEDGSAAAPAPHVRAIRALADPADSPGGALLLRDAAAAGPGGAAAAGGGLRWAGSWNLPASPVALAADHPLPAALGRQEEDAVLAFGPSGALPAAPADLAAAFGPLWLAVPLVHHREGLIGAVLLAPPRAPFAPDREARDLLRTVGREVALFLAERRAAERLAEGRRVADYAKRFAFVAHDVKTVSSQLGMLLANAEDNLQDPEFQRDMLLTVRASAARINALILRLNQPGEEQPAPGAAAPAAATAPAERLRAMAAAHRHPVRVEAEAAADGAPLLAAVAAERFDAAAGHLLNNAVEASAPGGAPVRARVRRDPAAPGRVLVEIADRGPGMSPEFVRDELFRPLSTSKPGGSGIGAWQARELLREAGGDLAVLSRPGEGTTMRLLLPAWTGPAAVMGAPEAAPARRVEELPA